MKNYVIFFIYNFFYNNLSNIILKIFLFYDLILKLFLKNRKWENKIKLIIISVTFYDK